MSAAILVVCDDLLFWSKIEGAARAAGARVRRASGPEDARSAIDSGGIRRVLADLSSRSIDPIASAPRWKEATDPPELIAFVSHVDEEAQDRARRAGFDRVLSRSAFVRELRSLLRP